MGEGPGCGSVLGSSSVCGARLGRGQRRGAGLLTPGPAVTHSDQTSQGGPGGAAATSTPHGCAPWLVTTRLSSSLPGSSSLRDPGGQSPYHLDTPSCPLRSDVMAKASGRGNAVLPVRRLPTAHRCHVEQPASGHTLAVITPQQPHSTPQSPCPGHGPSE